MITRPFGVVLMGVACLLVGLAGIAGFWVATEARTPGTSPLAQLFTLSWSITYIAASVLAWRRSRFAAYAFLAAMGFLVFLLQRIFPGGQGVQIAPLVVTFLVAVFGYRYLRRESQRLA